MREFFRVFIFFWLILILIYGYVLLKPVATGKTIGSDGFGYYAYLPTLFLSHSLKIADPYQYEPDHDFLAFPALTRLPGSHYYLIKYPPGVAFLVSPFFLLATLLSFLTQLPPDGYNPVYQFVVGLAAGFYVAFGLAICFHLYRRLFSRKSALVTVVLLLLGTNLLTYTVFYPTMSHAFSFFSISLVLLLIVWWWDKPRDLTRSILLGTSFGLTFLIRNSHLVLVLFWLLYGVSSVGSLRARLVSFGQYWKPVLLTLLVAFVTFLPELLYYWLVTSQIYVFPYLGESFNFLKPAWYGVLLSPRRGLFFWTPVMFLIFLGLGNFSRVKKILLAAVILLVMQAYIIASWRQWWFGDGFGHRAFIDSYPVMGLFIAAGLPLLWKNSFTRIFSIALIILLVWYNLFLTGQYWAGNLPRDHVKLDTVIRVLTNGHYF